MSFRRSALPFCLLLALAAAGGARAEVFLRLGKGAQALEQLGGVRLTSSDVRVNGQPGRIAVYGFASAPEVLVPDLRKALPMPDLGRGDAALATRVADGQATTVVVIPGSQPRQSVVMLVEQTAAAFRKAQELPAEWPGGLGYPGVAPTFTAEIAQTRTSLALATTPEAPEAAAARMENVLRTAGWSRVSPRAEAAGAAAFYARGQRICVVRAAADGPDGRTRITVLQHLGGSP
jgi:hypothetical protein